MVTDNWLSPESLGMDRAVIAMEDRMIRVFAGRGAVSLRDHTVTGLRELRFTPFEHRDWIFWLGFREESTGCLIDDNVADVWDQHRRTGGGRHPLGLNFGAGTRSPAETGEKGANRALITQSCRWEPGRIQRTGTFHKRIDGQWISFGIESSTRVHHDTDTIQLTIVITNRDDQPLRLVMLPRQEVRDPATGVDQAQRLDWRRVLIPARPPATDGSGALPAFQSAVSCDAEAQNAQPQNAQPQNAQPEDAQAQDGGWVVEIAGQQRRTVQLVIALLPADASAPAAHLTGLTELAAHAEAGPRRRLSTAAASLPRLDTAVPGLAEFYQRSVLSVLDARWERSDWAINPFYAAGEWLFTLAWDVCFSSAALALMDPAGLRTAVRAYVDAGLTRHSYVGWDGSLGHHYAYTVFSAFWILRDYLDVTGDAAFLDETGPDGSSILARLDAALAQVRSRVAEDGLVDFGADTHDYLETRTDGYQHRIAAATLMFADALFWLAEVRERRGEDAATYRKEAATLHRDVDTLWNADHQWYASRWADGSEHLTWSYHQLDVLRCANLDRSRRVALSTHIRPGVFLGPHGMYSNARTDLVHFDADDADWGGGGQYIGMPTRTAESLFRLGDAQRGWDILSRCLTWSSAFPYYPQEVFTDRLATPNVEQCVEISAGGGIQAVIFGVFGIRPSSDGSLVIEPGYLAPLVGSSLHGYRHHDHLVDVHLGLTGFRVVLDGESHEGVYGASVTLLGE